MTPTSQHREAAANLTKCCCFLAGKSPEVVHGWVAWHQTAATGATVAGASEGHSIPEVPGLVAAGARYLH